MRCDVCKKGFKDGDMLVPLLKYTENHRRGDFVALTPVAYVHYRHLKEALSA